MRGYCYAEQTAASSKCTR